MKFFYDGQYYETEVDASTIYQQDCPIQLPEGTYVRVSYWLESMPPQPKSIREAHESEVWNETIVQAHNA